jgi:hypothetical protein
MKNTIFEKPKRGMWETILDLSFNESNEISSLSQEGLRDIHNQYVIKNPATSLMTEFLLEDELEAIKAFCCVNKNQIGLYRKVFLIKSNTISNSRFRSKRDLEKLFVTEKAPKPPEEIALSYFKNRL